MSEKYKKALRIAVNVGCGFEGDAEDAAELLTLITGLESRIAALKGVIEILEDQQREVKNILIDKNLHIDSLYEEGYKLQQRIAELEAENAMLKQLPQPIKFWSDEKKQIYKINESRTAKSGSEGCGDGT